MRLQIALRCLSLLMGNMKTIIGILGFSIVVFVASVAIILNFAINLYKKLKKNENSLDSSNRF